MPETQSLPNALVLLIVGGILGFFLKWLLAERKEFHELRRSIAPLRAEAYKSLWAVCQQDLATIDPAARLRAFDTWYQAGGGLFLSLEAAGHYFAIVQLLKRPALDATAVQELGGHMTWLRTEMKYHVGSYSRREADTQIPSARPRHKPRVP